jgi:PAS domain S-box-containing protein
MNILKKLFTNAEFMRFTNSLHEGIVCLDTSGKLIFCNNAAEKILNLTKEELINRIVTDPHWYCIHEDGSNFPVEARPSALTLKTGQPHYNIVMGVQQSGGEFSWLTVNTEPVFAENSHELSGVIISFVDSTELIKLNNSLTASNKELEELASIVSHDLQEPLRMVDSFLDLLEKRTKDQLDETSLQYIHFAVDGSNRMRIMIEDLLQYSRVGTTKKDFSDIDLNEVVQYVSRVLEEETKKSQAVITVNPMPVITANKTLITQLFVNLVGNALKFHGDKAPNIELGFTKDASEWTFYVKDNGIGIKPKDMDRIFIIFQRLHNKKKYPGTGIGLAICKKIVDMHKGKIWVESEPGKGSTFYFSLPTELAEIPKQKLK